MTGFDNLYSKLLEVNAGSVAAPTGGAPAQSPENIQKQVMQNIQAAIMGIKKTTQQSVSRAKASTNDPAALSKMLSDIQKQEERQIQNALKS